jgi:hypothetical protein
MQQEMYRQWMNGWPVKPPEATAADDRGAVKEKIRSYQKKWSQTLAETMEKHREALNEQYKSGILAIESAFRTTEASTPEEYWRLTQEFWRKSIDSYKSAFEAQSKYVQGLSQMWQDMMTTGKV